MYWLVVTLCLAAADGGEVCEKRLASRDPVPGYVCGMIGSHLLTVNPDLKHFYCTSEEPDYPLLAAPVPRWRWA